MIVVNEPVPVFLAALPAYADLERRSAPRSVCALAAFVPLEMTRTDAKTLTLRARSGSLLACEQREGVLMNGVYFLSDFNSLVRDKNQPMRAGHRVELRRLSVEVTRVDEEGMPTEAVFRFDVSLDNPGLRWVRFTREARYVPFRVPAVGESVLISDVF